jgi:hypothetical protein
MKHAFRTIVSITVLLFAGTISRAADDKPAPPSTAPAAGDQAGVNRFYGTISAVDADSKTFVVDNQTYCVVPETQMTKAADGSTATMSDVTIGEPARGSFTKSSDGKLHVTKVRFGKKAGGSKGGGGKKNKDATTQPAAQ